MFESTSHNAMPPGLLFNPRPEVRYIPITEHHVCTVIDDFLLEPERILAYAVAQRERFKFDRDNYFPGPELSLGREFSIALQEFFMQYVRHGLKVRRNLGVSCRLSMATLKCDQLHPLQRLCHRDAEQFNEGEGIAASVLYLFNNIALGGTSFYRPKKPLNEISQLMHQANTLSNPEFTGLIGTEPVYMHQSNAYFEKVCSIPAAWNRIIFYDGTIFHAAQIEQPQLLQNDPAHGRLTMNGFLNIARPVRVKVI